MDPAAKRALATSFFKDVSQIRDVRQKNELFPGRLAEQALGLEAARFNLERARKQADVEDRVGALGQEADDMTIGILDDPDLLPEEKASALQRAHFEALRKLPPSASGSASWLSRKFGAAMGVVKPQAQSDFTPSQIARFVADGGDPTVIETGDPVLIGRSMAEVAENKRRATESQAQAAAADADQRRASKAFQDALDSIPDLDFAVDEDTGKVDETKFKRGDIVVPRLKRALGLSPDPQIRALGQAAGDDAKKLKAAAMKAYEVPANVGPKVALPARP
jgi:PAS domain-containing protein